ncbi:MAG: HpcH/HpaI aldolase/citrate lyase family protein [Clostridium sp.]|nr:HpcH/HpaI aldolase/citrate lyase family protein [Clostridium sp.]
MSLKLMYITNNVEVAKIAEQAGVDRIWIDLEKLGKEERQKGDTVKSNHCIGDIGSIKPYLRKAKLMVRVNPIHSQSKTEIQQVIRAGADIIMLPYYQTVDEVKKFLCYVSGKCRTCLLLETRQAHECLKETLKLDGIDEMYIGLNDLHLSYKKKFMFELLTDGTVYDITTQFCNVNMPFGLGGIARLGVGTLPADYIIAEHYRLGSSSAILSRSFCRAEEYQNHPKEFERQFKEEVKRIRDYEKKLQLKTESFFEENYIEMKHRIEEIVAGVM